MQFVSISVFSFHILGSGNNWNPGCEALWLLQCDTLQSADVDHTRILVLYHRTNQSLDSYGLYDT